MSEETWRPLSVRRGLREDHVLAEGVPEHLGDPLQRWLRPLLRDTVADMVRLRLSIVLVEGLQPAEALIRQCRSDEDVFLDVVDFVLQIHHLQARAANVGHLRFMLVLAGSAWTVGRDDAGLERRVEPTYADAAAGAVETGAALGNSAGDQLASAWRATYGRHPDPSRALAQAIKAVESAAAPVLTPNDKNATLGRLIGALRAETGRWRLPLIGSDKNDPAAMLVYVMGSLWHGQSDRHGGVATTEPVSQAQAEAALPLAIALVQLFAGGAVRRAL